MSHRDKEKNFFEIKKLKDKLLRILSKILNK